jgi:hypothetical protein
MVLLVVGGCARPSGSDPPAECGKESFIHSVNIDSIHTSHYDSAHSPAASVAGCGCACFCACSSCCVGCSVRHEDSESFHLFVHVVRPPPPSHRIAPAPSLPPPLHLLASPPLPLETEKQAQMPRRRCRTHFPATYEERTHRSNRGKSYRLPATTSERPLKVSPTVRSNCLRSLASMFAACDREDRMSKPENRV